MRLACCSSVAKPTARSNSPPACRSRAPTSTMIVVVKKTGAGDCCRSGLCGHQGAISGRFDRRADDDLGRWRELPELGTAGQAPIDRPRARRSTTSASGTCLLATRDANGISLSLNGQAPVTVAYTTPTPARPHRRTSCSATARRRRPIEGDLGLFAFWDRSMAAAEIASVYKAVKRLMLAKGDRDLGLRALPQNWK